MATTIKINGVDRTVDVDSDTPLLRVLRDVLGMTGTKFGCGMALCGACTVHIGGVANRSCIASIDSIGASEITTIEAIGLPVEVSLNTIDAVKASVMPATGIVTLTGQGSVRAEN